ncbi:Uncharacterised protein [Leclercia adecarboxylata]|nr:Uncharacterised protein [Leclercia adecarboxylata]
MRCASCASPNASLCCAVSCQAWRESSGIAVAQGPRFSAGCSSSQSATFETSRRPRWCAGSSRPSRGSTSQYSSGVQVACHCSSRFPVKLPPSWTTICACSSSVTAFALPSHRSAHGSGCPVWESTSPISGQPRVCAHSATFFPSAALILPASTTPRFCRQKNQSRCSGLESAAGARSQGLSLCHQSPSAWCQARSVSSISPYSGSANGQLMCSAPARNAPMALSTVETSQRAGISRVGRGRDSVSEGCEAKRPG